MENLTKEACQAYYESVIVESNIHFCDFVKSTNLEFKKICELLALSLSTQANSFYLKCFNNGVFLELKWADVSKLNNKTKAA